MLNRQPDNRERQAAEKKVRILQAALAVFSRKGYGEATIPDIAAEAGVAVGTIYLHYPGKRELLLSIISEFIVTEPFASLLKHAGKTNDEAFLSSIVSDRLDFGFDNADRFLFLVSEIQRDPELREQYKEKILAPMLSAMEKYFAGRMTAGGFRPMNAQLLARALPAMMMGLALINKLEGENSPLQNLPRQELASELTALILDGLRQASAKTLEN